MSKNNKHTSNRKDPRGRVNLVDNLPWKELSYLNSGGCEGCDLRMHRICTANFDNIPEDGKCDKTKSEYETGLARRL